MEVGMPSISDVNSLVKDLHSRKILNADTTLAEAMAVNAGHIGDRGTEAGWYVLGGEHYVIVCGMTDIAGKVSNPIARGGGNVSRPG
jgi:hypothetical protein